MKTKTQLQTQIRETRASLEQHFRTQQQAVDGMAREQVKLKRLIREWAMLRGVQFG